jgi:D-alanyl-D-alanine carboxypeptidase/D-alanyl-D-alanine-endopeptidase (penicillin-binding protein 4)
MKTKLLLIVISVSIYSCSSTKQIARAAKKNVLEDAALQTAHVGISIYEPATGKYVYNYQGDKYFVPASNTKIPTCYAAMKYLGDSLVGLRYEREGNDLIIEPTADPTFLHPEFKDQKAFDFLRTARNKIVVDASAWQDERWGSGWSWNDYGESYMAERSAMPIYGNVVKFSNSLNKLKVTPSYFLRNIVRDSSQNGDFYPASVNRDIAANIFLIGGKSKTERSVEVSFYTKNGEIIDSLLSDTLHTVIEKRANHGTAKKDAIIIHSQPTDSLLKPMMHRSDNFFAEQSLLMVSNEKLGVMNDAKIIDTLLKTDFKDLPQAPRWVDGSGLSRYNLFTPQDLVAILNKMQTEFGMARIKEILPTGNEGTLTNYYKAERGYIFAKTGTLSGVVAISGFLYTKKDKLLIFSVLVNNHQASATAVRRAVERFIEEVRER